MPTLIIADLAQAYPKHVETRQDWLFNIAGEMWTYLEDHPSERQVYRPGDLAMLRRRQVKGFRLLEGCWLLEYGRGPIPTCLPFGVSGALASLDFSTVWRTFKIYGRLTIKELLRGKL